VAKVVVVLADGRPVELIFPAGWRVNLERVREALHAQVVRPASETELDKLFTECVVGDRPALRHWKGVDVLMDRSLQAEGKFLFQAGSYADAVRLNFRDWYEAVKPQVAIISEPAEVAHAGTTGPP
jgi:Ala-tRNA(Pro) deacylase